MLEVADLTHGVDATEARALAEAYFCMSEGFDGGLWSMQREGDWWRFETVVGPAGTEGKDIRIHADNGQILMEGEKSVPAPWDALKSFFADMIARTNAEHVGAGLPFSAPESTPEGKEKPKPESEGRPQ